MRNKEAIAHLENYGIDDADYVVRRLIEGGFLPEDKLTTPERYAEIAKDFLGYRSNYSQSPFSFASGWGSSNWEFVLKTELGEDFSLDCNIQGNKDVFAATVILAKEAGVL